MAKRITPAMEKIQKRNAKRGGAPRKSTPGYEAWKRLRRNKLALVGMGILICFVLMAIFAPLLAPYPYDVQNYDEVLLKPSAAHWFGTDNFGRDIFSRCIWGARISIPIGIICTMISAVVGGSFGAVAAYYGGRIDNIIMRVSDIIMSIPRMLLAIALAAVMSGGVKALIIALPIGTMPLYARVVRANVLTVKDKDYIESSRAIGASTGRLILSHMIPNCVGPIIVQITFSVAASILTIASLSYVGLGIAPPTPEWGSMLNAGKQFLQTQPHMLIFPGLMIAITVLALNLFGDGLRDALDPRLK